MRTQSRPVACYSSNGELLRIYQSIYMAHKDTNVPKALIKKCINGKNVRPYRHLYVWKDYDTSN